MYFFLTKKYKQNFLHTKKWGLSDYDETKTMATNYVDDFDSAFSNATHLGCK